MKKIIAMLMFLVCIFSLSIAAQEERIVVVESIGEYTVTAYCACEKCCGKWAAKQGETVKGAYGIPLESGVSIASPLPKNTVVYIEGVGRLVCHDKTSKWVAEKYHDRIIDIYFDDHKKAVAFAKQKLEVYVRKDETVSKQRGQEESAPSVRLGRND